jgi:16S rRNA (cytosine1402-N4)-methyltransferase
MPPAAMCEIAGKPSPAKRSRALNLDRRMEVPEVGKPFFVPPMSDFSSAHVSVLLDEVVQWLQPRPGSTLVDGTLGGGGHARALAERVAPGGLVIALDRDGAAVEAAQRRLAGLPVRAAQANFCDLPEVLDQWDIREVDGVVLDLGLSTDQLADAARGFSFSADGPLDLRFDPSSGEPAWRLVNRLSAEHLADVIYRYGEERCSRRIARAIVEARRAGPIQRAAELADLVRRCVPMPRGGHRIDAATRTFQALRIAVNDELKSLEIALRRIPDRLRPQGRLAVISFHSLEDRRVKEAFRDDPRYDVLTRKPVRPSPEETADNPRSRSAKLRVAARRTAESTRQPT